MSRRRQTTRETLRLIRADIERRCAYEDRPSHRLMRLRYLFNPGVTAVVLARWQRWFDDHHLGLLGGVCRWLNVLLFTTHIDSDAQIDGGFVLVHANAVWIGPGSVIGPGCLLFSQNAIGKSPFLEGREATQAAGPQLGASVVLGIGACVHGAITVGDGCRIAVNSLVEQDAAPGSTLYGVPARVVN